MSEERWRLELQLQRVHGIGFSAGVLYALAMVKNPHVDQTPTTAPAGSDGGEP